MQDADEAPGQGTEGLVARGSYDPRRVAGDSPEAALQHLANKLVGQLHHSCRGRLDHKSPSRSALTGLVTTAGGRD